MSDELIIKNVEPKELLGSVEEFHRQGYRFVQLCATKLDENSFEITYSFDKDYKLSHLRLAIPKETNLPSVTGIYKGVFLYENEIREFFGINFTGISVDYRGHLYKKKIPYPFNTDTSKVDESCQQK